MSSKVGTKGQVVIEKSIRDQLGILPGYKTMQFVQDDTLVLRFIAPEHNQSLRGAAKSLRSSATPPKTNWDEALSQTFQEDWLRSTSPKKDAGERKTNVEKK